MDYLQQVGIISSANITQEATVGLPGDSNVEQRQLVVL